MIEQLDLLREDYGTATLVVWGAFFIGVLFGVIAEFSRYCARAALAEWAPGDERSAGAANGHPRSKQYLTAVLVALAGTQLLFVSQNIDLAQSIYWSVPIRPLALLAGGLLFGAGMVLAGGCVSRLLVLAASGNGRSIVTLLVTGIAGYATLRGILSYPRIWLETAWSLEATPAQVFESGTVSPLLIAAAMAVTLAILLALLIRRSGMKGIATGAADMKLAESSDDFRSQEIASFLRVRSRFDQAEGTGGADDGMALISRTNPHVHVVVDRPGIGDGGNGRSGKNGESGDGFFQE